MDGQATDVVQDEEQAVEQPSEAGRARVRRLCLDPLARDGMRYPAKVPPEDARRKLDQLADDLAYLSDAGLRVLATSLRTKGEGSAKCFWPSRITVLGYAEAFQKRPLADMPGLRSWFASAAGRDAAAEPGRLIAEYAFWNRHKHPPFAPAHQQRVASHAGDIARRIDLLSEREAREVPLDADDRRWLDRVRSTEAMLQGWIEERANT